MTKKEYIKKLRTGKGYNIQQGADLIGLQRTTLSKLESGALKLSNDMFFRIVRGYDLNISIKVEDAGDNHIFRP